MTALPAGLLAAVPRLTMTINGNREWTLDSAN
jgi:hypothetical protein